MTDTTLGSTGSGHDWSSPASRRRVKRRYAADRRLQFYGIAAIGTAMALLGVLFVSLIQAGYAAFTTTKVELSIFLDPAAISQEKPGEANYRRIVRDAFKAYFPDVTGRSDERSLYKIMSSGSDYIVRDYVVGNPGKIGENVKILVPVSDPFDQLYKRIIPRRIDALSSDRIALFDALKQQGVLSVEDGAGVAKVSVFIDPAKVPSEGGVAAADYDAMIKDGLRSYFRNEYSRSYEEIISATAAEKLQSVVAADPSVVGKIVEVKLPLAANYDNLLQTGQATIRNPRFGSDVEFAWFDSLEKRGLIATPFTWELFFNADSRFPELAGLAGALSGSLLALLICFVLSFPIGIATAVYLEEFAPKNRTTDLIEVNINNLAAVPSVVFGLLGLALFLNTFGMPRSAPLVGGMVLALMTLPTIIVATRAALKAVPPSIREAALGVGASRHQVALHHVLPLAMPGILTGTIIGLAQALGETAPLLLIGMNAFIPSVENIGLTEPAMALPTQIFSWADSPERGFVSRTSAAILVLLGFLVMMNLLAVYLRRKLERKW
ncbi:MAG: phosphate ABC transporter permease PstA [Alphaproteobacteria bacterium]|nr:phosphate ABC transporter permease PstA [Alphaproteobacteria bacterium]